MAHPAIGLDDIPNEILIQIFDRSKADISTKSLLNLSLSCRRLHFLCLPIYLSRYGIKKPTEHCEIVLRGPQQTSRSIDALTGLRIALFIPYVKDLVCRFQVPGDVEDYLYVGAHLRRLHDFLSSLSSVSNVTLQFGNKRCGCCSELEPGETLDKDLKKWSNAMASVLNLLLEKSCGEMTIVGGKFMCHTYILKTGNNFRTASHNTGALATLRRLVRQGRFAVNLPRSGNWINVLQGDHWEFRRDPETGKSTVLTSLSKAARTSSVLKSLTISSMMFGIPPLLHWMISVLRLPTTQSLTLKNFPLTRKAWLVILSLVSEHCSHLTELRFSRLRQLNARDIVYFVGQFPNLSSLHLGRSVEFYSEEDLGPFPILPHLKTLHAPAPWLFKLLTSRPNGLPALENISIAYTYSRGTVLHWLKTSSSDPSIPSLLANFPRLSSITLKVVLGKSPGFRMSEDSKAPKRREPEILKNVIRLNLMIDYELKTGDVPLAKVLPNWLARFYGLRHLLIKATPSALSDAEVSVLAILIVKEGKSPLLESFETNGVEVDLNNERSS